MSNALRKIKRKGKKRHTCRKCKGRMLYKSSYGWTCPECGWTQWEDDKDED